MRRDDKTIKAIVIRVDSPGGSGLASDIIWHAVEAAKQKKPVVISMSDVAASGGYYISLRREQDHSRSPRQLPVQSVWLRASRSLKVYTIGWEFQQRIRASWQAMRECFARRKNSPRK